MNILILIISSDSLSHYKKNKEVWKLYMNKFSNIHSYFIENSMNETNESPYLEGDTLYCKGEESFQNILKKTINGIEYFMKSDIHYDFIVRTNLSSVWCFDSLVCYLKTLPKTNVYSGPRGPYYNLENHHFWFYFVGGMGIIMSNDICQLLIKNRTIAESFNNMDDIDIGYTMHTLNIPILPINYAGVDSLSDYEQKKSTIQWNEPIFYRAKSISDNREDEPIYMDKMVRHIYPELFTTSLTSPNYYSPNSLEVHCPVLRM
jgi:hypothetical protein